jgi:hypothetical protein
MHRTFLGYTILEWVLASAFLLLVGLFVARLVWAPQIQAFEDSLFAALGLQGAWKYALTVPLAGYWLWSVYSRERAKAQSEGVQLVRPSVAIAAVSVLVSIVVLVVVVAG